MPPELYIRCPKCGHTYNIDRTLLSHKPPLLMYCPMCTSRFDRDEATVVGSNFDRGMGDREPKTSGKAT